MKPYYENPIRQTPDSCSTTCLDNRVQQAWPPLRLRSKSPWTRVLYVQPTVAIQLWPQLERVCLMGSARQAPWFRGTYSRRFDHRLSAIQASVSKVRSWPRAARCGRHTFRWSSRRRCTPIPPLGDDVRDASLRDCDLQPIRRSAYVAERLRVSVPRRPQ